MAVPPHRKHMFKTIEDFFALAFEVAQKKEREGIYEKSKTSLSVGKGFTRAFSIAWIGIPSPIKLTAKENKRTTNLSALLVHSHGK